MRSVSLASTVACFSVLLLLTSSVAAVRSPVQQEVFAQLAASADGRIYVVIATTASVLKPGQGLTTLQAQNQATRDRILSTLDAGDFEPVYLWENVSGMTGRVTFSGLQKLAVHPDVVAVGPDERGHATLDSSVPYINADNVHNAGITGAGITIAVLDTGIDTDHADLSDNIAAGAWKFLDQGVTTGPGAEDDDGHGTNVSSIITSRGVVSSVGVAPNADILAIKVLDSTGSGWLSDWISGVNYVVSNAGNYTNLCAMNMSLGSNTLYSQCPCDNANATNIALKNALANAINAGIASFASSGNDASTTSMGAPACITGATAVAAVYEADLGREPNSGTYSSGCFDGTTTSTQITCFSNRSGCNELAAPGRSIVASGFGGGISNFTGTSQAAPHAAGVAALMCQVADSLGNSLTPAQMVQTMKSTGTATFDPAATSPNPILINALGAVLGGIPAAVTLTASVPSSGFVGTSVDIVLLGGNFSDFFDASFGADITVNTLASAVGGDSLFVNITIDDLGTPGLRDIFVTDSFSADTLASGFSVLATTRHYAAPGGGNVWPYITPANAATSIASALSAALTGDSILVDSTTVNLSSLTINKGVTLYGGWTNGFTARDVDNTPTTLNLSANVSMLAASGVAGMDGFLIQGGAGTADSQPISGNYGGAIKVLLGSVRIANCQIRNCDANTGSGFGGGGAIFVKGAVADIANNWIHTNIATRAGAIYLYNSTGSSLTGNLIENNSIAVANLNDPYGAGIVLDQCTNTVLSGNVVQNNSGAIRGGGAWVTASANTQWSGGSVANHSVSNNGGGLYFTNSVASLDSVMVAGNSSSLFGGGISTDSDITVSQCVFVNNHAIIGGGLSASGGTSDILHNLWLENTSLSSGAALSLSGITGATIIGNTLDRNSANAGAGGMLLASSTFVVTNNIVTNSAGSGITCSNATATLSYNLVWNSSASNYAGCTAGVGSLSSDPAFADTMNVDYHLGLHSPAIDAADPGVQWNDPDGSRGDMGWYGSHVSTMQQPEFPKNLLATTLSGDLLLGWDANPEADMDYYAVYCDSLSGFLPAAINFVGTSPDSLFNTGAVAADTLYYRIAALNTSGHASGYSAEVMAVPTSTSTPNLPPPTVTALRQNFPNPFNPLTTIRFDLARPGPVRLSIYDPRGRRVRVLVDATLPADRHERLWDGRDQRGARVSSGIYYSRLETAEGMFHRKMVLLK